MAALLAGAARLDITPPPGLAMAGYPDLRPVPGAPAFQTGAQGYYPRPGPAAGTHDPLFARALALGDGRETAAIVALDVCMVTAGLAAAVREQCGLPTRSVVVAATHTHSGPDVSGYWIDADQHARCIAALAAQAIQAAVAGMRPVQLRLARADIGEWVINRRDPAGPTDPELSLLLAEEEGSHRPLAILACCAAHPLVLPADNLLYSADWPGFLTAALEGAYPGAVALFLNGAAGNINPVGDPLFPKEDIVRQHRRALREGRPTPRTFRQAARLGRLVAGTALTALERAPVVPPGSVRAAQVAVRLPLRKPEDLRLYGEYLGLGQRRREELLSLAAMPAEVQALKLGPARLVALPGEPFVEIGLAIKQRLRGPLPVIAGYANADPRYIPTDAAFREDAYETFATPLAPGAAPALLRAAEEAIRQVESEGTLE